MTYKAVVVGATGLVGKHLVHELLQDVNCTEVRILVRRATDLQHPKLKQIIIDFENPNDYKKHLQGDVLFSCLGTTLKQAGDRKNQFRVDFTYQYWAAKFAAQNGIKNYVVVSSPFAKANSRNYYRAMKGKLEREIKKLQFDKIAILKPNGISGKREIPRTGEKEAMAAFGFLSKLFPNLKKYQPIEGKQVAQGMIKAFYFIQQNNQARVEFKRNELLELL